MTNIRVKTLSIAVVFNFLFLLPLYSFADKVKVNEVQYSIEDKRQELEELKAKLLLSSNGNLQRANYIEECIQKIDSLGKLYSQVIGLESKVRRYNKPTSIDLMDAKYYNTRYVNFINEVVDANKREDNLELRRLSYLLRDEVKEIEKRKTVLENSLKNL